MNEQQLFHMYQAWSQGLDEPERDHQAFIEWAAKWNNTTNEQVLRVLQNTRWFKQSAS